MMGHDGLTAARDAAPPATVAALSFSGVALETWVLVLTALYLVMQMAYLAWKFFTERAEKKARSRG